MTASFSTACVNLAAYHFVALEDLPSRRRTLQKLCGEAGLKGTILLAPEGINLFIAGTAEGTQRLLDHFREDPLLADLEVKVSYSREVPFERMLVKIKQEIIAFGREGIDPRTKTSGKIEPSELHAMLDRGEDVLLLDVRNDYEVRLGTFAGARAIGVNHFRDFPEAIEQLPSELQQRPIVMFCTGGIRCEKAGPFLEQAGFHNVRQLSGGILKYFEEIGGDHYDGECFVFDKRVALNAGLEETGTQMCFACLSPLTLEEQQSEQYDPPHVCPHCYQTPEQQQRRLLQERQSDIVRVSSPLPGNVPADQFRPLNVPLRYDRFTMFDYVTAAHPHRGRDYWERAFEEQRIQQSGKPVTAGRTVRSGEQYVHVEHAHIEPDVNADITILYEDDALVVANKPAPLPMHACGRFHRNTLQWILNQVYAPLKLRPAHRLDANTTGLAVFAKKRTISAKLQPQFEQRRVQKTYLARVMGSPEWSEFTCEAPISREPGECGGRVIDASGLAAQTHFRVLSREADGTSILKAVPLTGRTNQIRLHLWHLGIPVAGDPMYLPDRKLGQEQTLPVGSVMALHAWQLQSEHPQTGAAVTYTAPPPDWATLNGSSAKADFIAE